MSEEVFSTYRAAKICNVHPMTVINWANEGKLKAYVTPGGHRRIEKKDLLSFMDKYKIPVPDELTRRVKTVLVVADDFKALKEYKDGPDSKEVRLDFASNAFEAGRKIYAGPDLIFLDFRMPGMNGFKVCKLLHEDERTAGIPVVAISDSKSEKEAGRIKKCGVKASISKPLNVKKMSELIKELLSGRPVL